MNPLFIILIISQIFLVDILAINSDENAILNAQRAMKNIPRIARNGSKKWPEPKNPPHFSHPVSVQAEPEDSEKSGSASHGTAYKSIISNYYTNDPYFGPSQSPTTPKYTSKDEALQRLKAIIKQNKKTSGGVTGEKNDFYVNTILEFFGTGNIQQVLKIKYLKYFVVVHKRQKKKIKCLALPLYST